MNSYVIDKKYISFISLRVRNYKDKGGDLYNFSCPACGDSKKDKLKARGYLFYYKDGFVYKCHNCQFSTSLRGLLKDFFPELYSEYNLEVFRESRKSYLDISVSVKPKKEEPNRQQILIDSILDRVDLLPEDNVAVKYLLERKVPKDKWNLLYYIDDISKIHQLSDKYKSKITSTEPRLILPFFNRRSQLVAVTCRDLLGLSNIKYLIVNISEDDEKVFGIDRVDFNKQAYIVEGPIDSLFLPNAVAAGTSDLRKAAKHFLKDRVTLILDNQRQNKEIAKLYRKYATNGYSMFVWPEIIQEKDINELVMNGYSIENLPKLIKENTYSGLDLNLRLTRWLKV